MSLAHATAEPTRRGACPSLDMPMRTGDGLLARMRVAGACVSPAQLRSVAGLALLHGNGVVEISARGNLQVRGLSGDSVPRFAAGVHDLVQVETGLVVETSPLAGDDPHERFDPRPLAEAIRAGALSLQDRLGPKVTVVVDGRGQIDLAPLKADIRLEAADDGWLVTVDGGAPRFHDHTQAVRAALQCLQSLADIGKDARAIDLAPSQPRQRPEPSPPVGMRLPRRSGHSVPITLVFGQADAGALAELAQLCEHYRIRTLRLAPFHSLLVDDASDDLIRAIGDLGFIVSGDDARLRVSACIGSDGCASGHIRAREIGHRLAAAVPKDQRLHVSGCAKGCAYPARSARTLVGRADGVGLVIDGRAGDTPREVLRPELVEDALAGWKA